MLYQRKAKRTVGTMGPKVALLLFLLLGVLLSGLPAQDEDEEVVEFKGVGIHVRLGGGYSLLSGGDFHTGIQGMYDWGVQSIVSAGLTLGKSDERPLRSGYELGGDIVYYFAGRLGIGAGGTLARVNKMNKQLFSYGADPHDWAMRAVPQIDILSFRLGLFYALPINRLLTVCFNVGPAYYSVDYKYSGSIQEANYTYGLSQRAKAKDWGIQGGLGLEIRMNQRMGFIIEAQGRYAKISGFDGKEELYEFLGGPISKSEKNGFLYYLQEEGFPRLEVFPEAASAGPNAREAVFDFSGISFRAGLNFKF
ncbi:MAG: outer membrane beta-barrel protein [Candidatus Aminicenantes bacterium]|nr:outer membrane beta-barrel protein [Candidatus Aminicenantes bacterium]